MKMRCFIYFYLVFVQFYVGFCHFLELSDLLMVDTLPYIWSHRVTTQLLLTKCTIQTTDGSTKEGICKSRSQCLMSGGMVSGHCGLLSTCCTYGRVRTSNAKVSFFSSSDVSFAESPISFNVMRLDENVCQLRLDFLEFDLAFATQAESPNDFYKCNVDLFYVTPANVAPSMPQICGYNTGQHIYINVPREIRSISLNVRFTHRTKDLPKWNIKVTQLQCPIVLNKKGLIDKTVADDYSLLAPQGCLQYFTKVSGTIKSFGFKEDSPIEEGLVVDQYYAICFRKTPHICGIKFTSRNCTLGPCANNYFIMPGAIEPLTPKVCDADIPPDTIFYVKPPGPLNILFHISGYILNGGFSIDYVLEVCTP